MSWTFTTPTITPADNAIDAVCIHGKVYAEGGFCSGINYTGTTPAMWAVWFSDQDVDTFSQSIGLADAVDDKENWRRTDSLTTFD